MIEYKHVVIVSPETAEVINNGIIKQASYCGVGLIVSDEKGLTALSENFNQQELERLSNVLPKGTEARKANGVLHKLVYRLKNNPKERPVTENIGMPVSPTTTQDVSRQI